MPQHCFYDSDLALPFAFIRMKNAIDTGTYMKLGCGVDNSGKFYELFYCPSDGNLYLCYDSK